MINTTADVSKENRLADLDNLNNWLNTNYQLFENQSFEPKKIRKERRFLPLSEDNPFSRYMNTGGRPKGYLTEIEEKDLVVEYHWCDHHINSLEDKLKSESNKEISNKILELKKRRNEARDELILAYKFLVLGRVKDAMMNLQEFKYSKLSIDDLLQAGSLELIKSVDRYLKNPKKGLRYGAKKRVQWEIYDTIIADMRGTIPDNTYYLLRKLDRVGRLNPKELVKNSKKLKLSRLSLEEARGVIMLYQGYILSYDQPIGEDKERNLGDSMIDHSEILKTQRNEIKDIVLKNFKDLLPQQKLYIALKLGTGRILDPIPKKELLSITGLTKKEIRIIYIKYYHEGCRLSLKESTIKNIIRGELNGKPYTSDEIIDILKVDQSWIKAGEEGIKKLKNNPILKELI